MKETLFEMTKEASQLYDFLNSQDEMDEETKAQVFQDTVEAMGINEKLSNYCDVITQMNLDIESCKALVDKYSKKKKTIENNVKFLKTQIMCYLDAVGQKKEKAGLYSVSIRETEAVNVLDERKIPEEYLIIQPSKVNKTDIKKALKQGIAVEGAELQTNRSLTIK